MFQFLWWSSLRSGCLAWCAWRLESSELVWRTHSPRHPPVCPAARGETGGAPGPTRPPSGASASTRRSRSGGEWLGRPPSVPQRCQVISRRISAMLDGSSDSDCETSDVREEKHKSCFITCLQSRQQPTVQPLLRSLRSFGLSCTIVISNVILVLCVLTDMCTEEQSNKTPPMWNT